MNTNSQVSESSMSVGERFACAWVCITKLLPASDFETATGISSESGFELNIFFFFSLSVRFCVALVLPLLLQAAGLSIY